MAFRHLLLVFLFSLPYTALIALSADQDIFISEIQIAGDSPNDDFVELYNKNEKPIDISGWELRRKSKGEKGTGSLFHKFQDSIIPGKHFFLWTNKDGKADFIPLGDAQSKNKTSPILSDNNSLALFRDPKSPSIDSIGWKDAAVELADSFSTILFPNPPDNTSLVRNLQTLSWSSSNHPTPTNACENKKCPEPTPIEKTASTTTLRINEVLPNPSAKKDDGEYIELYNTGDQDIDLSGWQIRLSTWPIDLTKKQTEFSIKTNLNGETPPIINSRGFFTILRNRNSTLTLSNTEKFIELIDPSNVAIDSMHYEKAETDIAFNYTANGWRKSKMLTPGTENILNNAPETKKTDIPEIAFLNVLTSFSASGKDSDGDTIRYTWNFGDGHKSYKRETTHRYEKKGAYEGTLTVTDGTEKTITTFMIEVEKYEAPKVRMTSLIPNPAGKDTGTEGIEIENRSKKTVDLIGWSIATGWKKLINHPIRESFVINGKSKRTLTHSFSAFTLPNEKGRIELRSPDGKTVQKLKYNLKGKSAEEDAHLIKEKGGKWEWITNQGAENKEQRAIQAAVVPPAGGASAVREQRIDIDKQEARLNQDTEIITLKKENGERLISMEKDSREEMRKLIGFGTDIETPIAVLDSIPRVAGARSDSSSEEDIPEDTGFDLNAMINNWLAEE